MTVLPLINSSVFYYVAACSCFFGDILLANVVGHQFFYLTACLFISFIIKQKSNSLTGFSFCLLVLTAFLKFEYSMIMVIIAPSIIFAAKKLKKFIDSPLVIGYCLVLLFCLEVVLARAFLTEEGIGYWFTFVELLVNMVLLTLFLNYFVRHELGNRSYY